MAKMIVVLLMVAIAAVAVEGGAIPREYQLFSKALRPGCMKESGATVELLDNASNGDFPEDPRLKGYFKCLMNRFALIQNGKINFDMMLLMVPIATKAESTRAIQKCRNETGKDVVDQLWNFNKCYYKETPESYFVM